MNFLTQSVLEEVFLSGQTIENYIPMSPSYNTIAFQAAKDLVFDGINQPSGYTEPILHKRRIEFKLKNKV